MATTPPLEASLRAMLLPIADEDWAAAAASAEKALSAIGLEDPLDQAQWLADGQRVWQEAGTPSPELTAVVSAALGACSSSVAARLTRKYFTVHDSLLADRALDHDQATAMLAESPFVETLIADQQMSATRVATILRARDGGLAANRQAVGVIAAILELEPTLSTHQVLSLYDADTEDELRAFEDADDAAVLALASEAALRVGLDDQFGQDLGLLLGPDLPSFGPYLQMLHFLCSVAAYWDHELGELYEFKPRGSAANALCAKYPLSIAPAGNPFLNNAKGVARLDEAWALTRTGERTQALALARLVSRLDWLGFAARRQVARWIRLLLVRHIRVGSGSPIHLIPALDDDAALALARAIAASPTGTRGVAEQRLLDACGQALFQAPEWVARGLGDPVNASNASRQKLGDCEFVRASTLEIVALEAHAGRLSNAYIDEHLRTLSGQLSRRMEEWDGIRDSEARLTMTLRFVAHDVTGVDLASLATECLPARSAVQIDAITFQDLVALAAATGELTDLTNNCIVDAANQPRTPTAIRETVRGLTEGRETP